MIEDQLDGLLAQMEASRALSREIHESLTRMVDSVTKIAPDPVKDAELAGARKALDAVIAMLESCNDRIVPIGWDKSAWEMFCLHRYGAADDVRAMKPEDILTER